MWTVRDYVLPVRNAGNIGIRSILAVALKKYARIVVKAGRVASRLCVDTSFVRPMAVRTQRIIFTEWVQV